MDRACIALAALLAWPAAARAQDPSDAVFDESVVASYQITMSAADWNAIVSDPANQGHVWKPATMSWQGETVSQVAVRSAKSYLPGNRKPTIRIKFDEFVPGQRWRGLDVVKLDSMMGNTDPSMMVERLAFWTCRQAGAAAPRACHARLTVNGDFKGLYEVIEPVRKAFVRYRWGIANPDGNLYKIDYLIGGQALFPFDQYLWRGSNPATYVPDIFHPETNEVGGDYRDVVTLLDILNNGASADRRTRLEGHINLDQFLRHLAVMVATSNYDAIVEHAATPNNHFWYHREDTNRLEIVAWDCDVTFGNWTGDSDDWRDDGGTTGWPGDTANYSVWYQFSTTRATSWIEGDSVARAAYLTKLQQVLDGPFSALQGRIDFVSGQIRSHAYADPYKPFANADFDFAVNRIRNDWIPRRIASLRSQLPSGINNAAFVSQSVPSTLTAGQTATVTVTMKNTGTTTWTDASYKLGSQNPADNATWGSNRVPLPGGASVGPNQQAAFTWTVTAPATAGTYNFQWQMRQSGVEWFGPLTPNVAVTVTALPTVTVAASDAGAAEPSNTGTFTVSRTGSTSAALAVGYAAAGTATPGSDYGALSGTVTIPAGSASATVTVTPLDDPAVESAETVILTLSSGAGYTVGAPSAATVTIADNDGGATPPAITAPAAGTTLSPGQTVTATGTGTNLSWSINRVGDGLPAFATGPGATITFTVPADSTSAQSIQITLTGDGGMAEQTHAIQPSTTLTATLQDGAGGYGGTKDATLSQSSPATNFGGDPTVRVDGDEVGGSDLVGLVRFDLRSIPAGSSIQTVELTLAVTNPSGGSYELFEAKRPWVEGEATWELYAVGQPWEAAGAQGPMDRGTTVLGTLASAVTGPATVTLNGAGVARVQSWVDAPSANFGFILANPTNPDSVAFESREAGTAANRPRLTVIYSAGAPPADTDGDGMPDGWENAHALNPSDPADGSLDADGDGFTNLQEYLGGTNPNDPASRPAGGGGGGGGGCGATGGEAILLLGLLGLFFRRTARHVRPPHLG
jgi:hypothetical protein